MPFIRFKGKSFSRQAFLHSSEVQGKENKIRFCCILSSFFRYYGIENWIRIVRGFLTRIFLWTQRFLTMSSKKLLLVLSRFLSSQIILFVTIRDIDELIRIKYMDLLFSRFFVIGSDFIIKF